MRAGFRTSGRRKTKNISLLRSLRPTLPILIGASLMLSLSMGLRQSLGIFLQPLTHDVGISVSDFTLAIAVQNLAWGFLQPLAGAFTVRFGFRAIMLAGALLYVAGLSLMAGAQGFPSVMLGAGVLIGMSLACTAAAIAMSVAARAVPAMRAQHGAGDRLGRGVAGRVDGGAVWGKSSIRITAGGQVLLALWSCRWRWCRRPGSPARSTRFRCRGRLPTKSATARRRWRRRLHSAMPHSW